MALNSFPRAHVLLNYSLTSEVYKWRLIFVQQAALDTAQVKLESMKQAVKPKKT